MDIMGKIRTLQSWIQDLTLRLEQNPQSSDTLSILESLQESERSLFADVHLERKFICTRTSRIKIGMKNVLGKTKIMIYHKIDSDDERYFLLSRRGRGLYRRKNLKRRR